MNLDKVNEIATIPVLERHMTTLFILLQSR